LLEIIAIFAIYNELIMRINPFYLTNKIPEEYFCDRQIETEKLIKSFTNQENVVLTAQRRVGKTGLINHSFNQNEIRDQFYLISIDILHTSSCAELVQVLGKESFEAVAKKSVRLTKLFVSTMKSITASFGYDPVTGGPSFDLKLGDLSQPSYTLDEIFSYLEAADKPVIVAIDEFQQICYYKEKNIEELLRGKIQKLSNTHFVFSGSSRRIMSQMFFSSKRPFYQSATSIELQPIEKQVYINFAKRLFSESGKDIQSEAVEMAYDKFSGVTMYIQRVIHDAYAMTSEGEICSIDNVRLACDDYIKESGSRLKELLSILSTPQKELLYAICAEGTAKAITSGAFIKKHNLRSTSAVQSAAKILLEMEYITKVGNSFTISDPIMNIWLKGLLYS